MRWPLKEHQEHLHILIVNSVTTHGKEFMYIHRLEYSPLVLEYSPHIFRSRFHFACDTIQSFIYLFFSFLVQTRNPNIFSVAFF